MIDELEQYLIVKNDNKYSHAYATLWGIAKVLLTEEQIQTMEKIIKENY